MKLKINLEIDELIEKNNKLNLTKFLKKWNDFNKGIEVSLLNKSLKIKKEDG